jgi:hypothetical protein
MGWGDASDSCHQFTPPAVGSEAPRNEDFGCQDLLLVAALTAALVIVFSSSISRGLDYAREIERRSGLRLMPALGVADGGILFHQYQRNHQQQAKAKAAELAKQGRTPR